MNLGQTFRIKVKAYNTAGEIESPILGVVLASLPLEPPAPSKVAAYSSHLQITVDFSDFPESSNGGCEISSFEVQKDNGQGGSFVSIAGYSLPYLITTITTTDVQKGRTYRFRYRAQNCHGWGPFSPQLFAIAASPPASPSAL